MSAIKEIAISYPNTTTRARVDERVEQGLASLLQSGTSRTGTPSVVAVVETIYDQFVPAKAPRPGREGGVEFTIDRSVPQQINLGGGANVVRALAPFTNRLDVLTRIGAQDWTKLKPLFQQLPKHVHMHMAIDPDNPTAKKIRYTVDGRVHATFNENPDNPSYEVENDMIDRVHRIRSNSLRRNMLISDYGRKSLTPRLMEAIQTSVLEKNNPEPIIIDPRPEALTWHKYNIVNGVIKPNKEEAVNLLQFIYGKDEQEVNRIIENLSSKRTKDVKLGAELAGDKILARLPKLKGILITLDKSGAVYTEADSGAPEYFSSIPVKVVNPSGAGDIVTATIALLNKRVGLPSAITSALHLASLSTEQADTSTLSTDLIRALKKRLRME